MRAGKSGAWNVVVWTWGVTMALTDVEFNRWIVRQLQDIGTVSCFVDGDSGSHSRDYTASGLTSLARFDI